MIKQGQKQIICRFLTTIFITIIKDIYYFYTIIFYFFLKIEEMRGTMRFVDTIDGLNDVFETDIPKNSVVLVTGAAGTLKSGFTFSVIIQLSGRTG